jgi:carboxymethylenebutenolidase
MSITTRYETVAASDGSGTFEAYCAVPESGSGPGMLLFQEIFGINDNIRGLCDRLAGEGYVTLAPDMFWRIEPRFERKDESGIGDAFAIVQKLDLAKAIEDIKATHAHLKAMPECTGKVGATGFCLGGALAFAAATQSKVDASVPYYGSAINDMLDQVDQLECPTMFHYGNNDAFIPEEKIAEVERAVAGKPNVVFHRYDAGHAFSNWDAPSMYDEAAATEAWGRTLAFLREHLS